MARCVDVRNPVRTARMVGTATIIGGRICGLHDAFRRWESFDTSALLARYRPLGVTELMRKSDHPTDAVRYANEHPSNPARRVQTVAARGVLANLHNGYPTILAEMTLVTVPPADHRRQLQ